MLQTVIAKKVNEQIGVIRLFSMFPSRGMVFKLSKKAHFLQFCSDLNKKPKSIKAIYIYASKRSLYTLSESSIFDYVMTYCFGNIRVRSPRCC